MPPRLILLPGLDGTGRLSKDFLHALVESGIDDASVLAYPADRPLGYEALTAFARAALPKRAPFVLLGESFSGPIALRIAAEPPPNLIGLMLSTTFARAPVPPLALLAPLIERAPLRSPSAWMLSPFLLGRWRSPALHAALDAALAGVAPAVLRARAATALRVDASASLTQVRVPTCVLRARHDRLLHAGCTTQLLQGIAGSRDIVLDGPHLLLQAQPRPGAEAVAAFLRVL
jgi:pimeloyl-ACP methyl ester carboxylesterase